MKKLILFVTLFLVGIVTFAQQDFKIDSTLKDVHAMPTAEQGEALLKSIAIGAGETMKTGYEIVVKQQFVYAIQYIAVGIVSFISLILFIIFYYFKSDKTNSLTPSILFLILFVWTGYVFSIHFSQIVQAFVNPEYAAISDIVKMTKSLISK